MALADYRNDEVPKPIRNKVHPILSIPPVLLSGDIHNIRIQD